MITRRHFLGTAGALVAATARGASAGRQKTILLKSAWDTINIGDIGHTPGALAVFAQHLPEVNIIVWASALDDRIRAMLHRRFPRLEIVDWLLEFDSTHAAGMTATLMGIHADYPAALAKVRRAMEFVRKRQADTMQVVRRILALA